MSANKTSGNNRDYEVGRGKPPVHSRFKKGQSGNPRGPRPKNLPALLVDALNEKVTVTIDGERREITKREAVATQLVNESTRANLRATKMMTNIPARQNSSDNLCPFVHLTGLFPGQRQAPPADSSNLSPIYPVNSVTNLPGSYTPPLPSPASGGGLGCGHGRVRVAVDGSPVSTGCGPRMCWSGSTTRPSPSRRPRPASCRPATSATPSVYGAQQHAPLVDVDVPI